MSKEQSDKRDEDVPANEEAKALFDEYRKNATWSACYELALSLRVIIERASTPSHAPRIAAPCDGCSLERGCYAGTEPCQKTIPSTTPQKYEIVFKQGQHHIYLKQFAVRIATFAPGVGEPDRNAVLGIANARSAIACSTARVESNEKVPLAWLVSASGEGSTDYRFCRTLWEVRQAYVDFVVGACDPAHKDEVDNFMAQFEANDEGWQGDLFTLSLYCATVEVHKFPAALLRSSDGSTETP